MTMDESDGVSRRDLLKGAATSVAMTLVGAQPTGARAQAGQVATGVVFEDAVGDGARRPESRPLPGVLVTNGRDIAVTDAAGRYGLAVSDETILSVIKPSGFMTPVDPETRLPRFYYIHQPNGSPAALDLAFEGVPPTGTLPSSIDFALRAQDEPKAFEVVLFTDPQPETDAEVDFIRDDVIAPLAATGAKFGITLGDMMFDDLSLYGRYNAIVGTIGPPWYNVGGNHDLNFEARDRRYCRETFKRVFGPPHYAFAYADAVFIVLDDVDYLGFDPAKPRGSGRYEGRLDPDQIAFVRNLLVHVPDDKLIVVAMHIPVRTYLDDQPLQNLANRQEFFQLFEGRRFTLSLSGHTHTTEHHYFGDADGWPSPVPHHHHVLTAVSGSWWSGPYDHRGVAVADSRDGSPNGFHLLSIDGNRYTTRFVPAKEPNGRQIRVTVRNQFHDEMRRDYRPGALLQPRVKHAELHAAVVCANVFDGGPRTKVSLAIGPAAPVAMMRQSMPDPFVDEVFTRYESTKKAWVKAEACSHLWTAHLPPLDPGAHRAIVTAEDEYGRPLTALFTLEVES